MKAETQNALYQVVASTAFGAEGPPSGKMSGCAPQHPHSPNSLTSSGEKWWD